MWHVQSHVYMYLQLLVLSFFTTSFTRTRHDQSYQASVNCSKRCILIWRWVLAASRSSIKFLRIPRIEPETTRWEVPALPLCYPAWPSPNSLLGYTFRGPLNLNPLWIQKSNKPMLQMWGPWVNVVWPVVALRLGYQNICLLCWS